jgi:hypothetical protein
MGLLAVAFILGPERDAAAFHSGGVGPCEGCHTMHNTDGGALVSGKPLARAYLLREQDPSSTCLYCHQHAGDSGPTSYHISTPINELLQGMPPKQLSPGGDFGWLNKTYTWLVSAGVPTAYYSKGERHGHNIVASDFLYDADGTYPVAPGGSYPAGSLACTSCHDPHGTYRRNADGSTTTTGLPIASSGSFASSPGPDSIKSVGVYRLLGGRNYQPKSLAGNYAFVYDPPAAVAPNAANRTETATQTRVAYGTGMSEWCRNCHPNMHTIVYPGNTNLLHAAGNTITFGGAKADNYNKYIKTGDLSGVSTASYLSLVPFEEGTADYVALKAHAKTDDSYLVGPDAASQVMCLSCHRAHASGWDGIMRWNAETSLIVSNGTVSAGSYAQEMQMYQPYGQGRTEIEALRAYYNRPEAKFAPNQDTLCNKCHIGVFP